MLVPADGRSTSGKCLGGPTKELIMAPEKRRPTQRIDLGHASRATRGAAGNMTDFVRFMEHWGIAQH